MKRTLKQLMRSAVVCFFCITLLTSSTYAWIDSRAAVAGDSTPDMELKWSDDFSKSLDQWESVETRNPLFTYTTGDAGWEPGHVQVRYLNAELRDSNGITQQYQIEVEKLEPMGETHLAQVIDVYFFDKIDNYSQINRSSLIEEKRIGTLAEVYTNDKQIVGSLTEGTPTKAALVLKMRDNAGPEYAGIDPQTFDLEFTLTAVVNNANDLQNAINNGSGNIVLDGDIDLGSGGLVFP